MSVKNTWKIKFKKSIEVKINITNMRNIQKCTKILERIK